MPAPLRSSYLTSGVLALLLAGCSSLSGPSQQKAPDDPAHGQAEAPRASASPDSEPEREAVEYQTQVAAMQIAGNFCEDERKLADYAYRYLNRTALPLPPRALSLTQAHCAGRIFLKNLIPSAGRIVGYKTEQMPLDTTTGHVSQMVAVRGNLLERMMLPSGVALATNRYAIHPRMEADMVAVVRSAAIHDAQTPREVLASLSAIRPYIELPDLAYEHPEQMNAADATVVNANARFGVLGEPIPVRVDQEMVDQLGNMTVRLTDQDGNELEAVKGSSLQGNPLNAVLWLIQDLEKAGIKLRPGDLLSLGAFGKRFKPEAGKSYRLSYDGLPNTPSVVVNFR
ncbi:MAG: hypothetical protein Q4B13_02130 [Lautropia sp.]|nr:hypothetical protein [Lautropia sp.]